MGLDALQTRKIKVFGSEKKEGDKQVSPKSTQIQSVLEESLKSLGKIFNCTLKDAASIRGSTKNWMDGWQLPTNQAYLGNSKLGYISIASFLGYCGHCWYMNFHSPPWKGLRGG